MTKSVKRKSKISKKDDKKVSKKDDKNKIKKEDIEKIKKKLESGGKLTPEDIEKIKTFKEQTAGESPLVRHIGKEDAEAVEVYAATILKKFTKFVKAVVVFGSIKTGAGKKKTSDIDIAIIVDDTDVKTMTRAEVKDKLFQRLIEQAYPISKKLHPQPYLLTEFWEYIREGNPVIINVLNSGVVVYDTGFFKPIQMLYKMGMISPSKERIDRNIIVSTKLLDSVKFELLTNVTREIALSVVNSAQALLMELGYRPSSLPETGPFVEEYLVKEHKLVEKEYADIAKRVVQFYKDVEHREIKHITGKKIDELYKDAEKFVNRMKKELLEIRKAKGETYLYEYFEKQKKAKKKRERERDTGDIKEKKKEKKGKKIIEEEVGMRWKVE